MGLDTRVFGDPVACRGAAQWLATLGSTLDSVAGSLQQARTQSEHAWSGSAGDAFRAHLSKILPNVDSMSDASTGLAWTLNQFGDQLEAVRTRMDHAAADALAAGLFVSGGFIAEPLSNNGPTGIPWLDSGTGPGAPANPGAEAAAAAAQAAYEAAVIAVGDARNLETAAHQDLNSRLQNWGRVLDTATSGAGWITGWDIAGGVATYLNTAAANYRLWSGEADVLAARAAEWMSFVDRSAAPTSAQAFVDSIGRSTTVMTALADQNSQMLSGPKPLPPNGAVVRFLAGDVNNALSRVKLPEASFAGKLPVVGVAVTGVQTATQIINGADPARTVVVNGGGLVAGTAAGSAAAWALTAVGVAGGPATIVVIAAGVLVSYGVGQVLERNIPQ